MTTEAHYKRTAELHGLITKEPEDHKHKRREDTHLLAMSQKRTHATTAYIMKMKPYMKVLALNPDEGEEAFPMFLLVELLVSSD